MKNHELHRRNRSNWSGVQGLTLQRWMISIGVIGLLLIVAIVPSNAGVISWTADVFDADADISTEGNLVLAINEGENAPAVIVNGVTFVANPGVGSLIPETPADSMRDYKYAGGAIGTLSNADAHSLLDTFEFGLGVGNSLLRLTGLIVGQAYELQLIVVNDYPAHAARTVDIGHASPSGNTTEVYTLTGVDHTGPGPIVLTGLFTADETLQDIHLACSGGGAMNAEVMAHQLRAVPEPSTLTLGILAAVSGLGLASFSRRKRA